MSTRITQLAQAFGAHSPRTFQDTVTFKRPTNSVDMVGGITSALNATLPSAIPCKYELFRGAQKETANKIIANSDYVLKIPSYYSAQLVDVDETCQAIVAARAGIGAEPARTFNIDWIGRKEGIEIEIYLSVEGG